MFHPSKLFLVTLLTGGLAFGVAFECFTCNTSPGADDSMPCVEQVEVCEPGIESCTIVSYSRHDKRSRVRKFCTSPGTPIYQYLLFFKGSALCQNIDTSEDGRPFPPSQFESEEILGSAGEPIEIGPPAPRPPSDQFAHRARRFRRSAQPPAPPHSHASSLLCVCSTERCNSGTIDQVMDRSILNRRPKELVKKKPDQGLQDLRA